MPNWVFHRLTITGPETERKRFIAECFSKTGDGMQFDFNKLIPEPEHNESEEDNIFGPNSGGGDVIFTGNVITIPADGGGFKFPAWYEWRCANWGTKWNAAHTTLEYGDDQMSLSFDTAGAPPMPIFHELAKRFPKLRIEGRIIEAYQFGGDIVCQNGSVEFDDQSEEISAEFERMMMRASQAH